MFIEYSNEGKQIVSIIGQLAPWEKHEMVSMLIDKFMSWGEMEDYVKDMGYVDERDFDPVQQVLDNGMEMDVLEEMDKEEICDYLSTTSDSKECAEYLWENLSGGERANIISSMDKESVELMMKELKGQDPLTYHFIKDC